MEELRSELSDREVLVGRGTVCRFLAGEDITFKKSVHAAEQERPDVAAESRQWKAICRPTAPTSIRSSKACEDQGAPA